MLDIAGSGTGVLEDGHGRGASCEQEASPDTYRRFTVFEVEPRVCEDVCISIFRLMGKLRSS